MNPHVILAHGEQIIFFMLALGVGALVFGVIGLVAALHKRRDEVSVLGAVCSVFGILGGGFLCLLHGAEPPFFDLLSIVMLLPLPLAMITLYLSFKRQDKKAGNARLSNPP